MTTTGCTQSMGTLQTLTASFFFFLKAKIEYFTGLKSKLDQRPMQCISASMKQKTNNLILDGSLTIYVRTILYLRTV